MMDAPKPTNEHYTYADYAQWPDDERWELIAGQAYAMGPSPMRAHQVIFVRLIGALDRYFDGKPCELLAAPMDVRLPRLDGGEAVVDTVVQPDILVVCDPKKLDDKGVIGAPDLVVEILSDSTAVRDMSEKLRLYEKHGVRCYIIVDPWGQILTIRYQKPEGGFGAPEVFAGEVKAPVRIFEGLEIDLARTFRGI